MTDPTSFRLSGAVDLGGMRQPPPAPAAGTSAHVIDVTEATFQADVIERSRQVPVVIDFWASWCGPCKQLSPILERLADEGAGSWVLAKIDVDANQRIAQAAAVQGIPAVKAVVDGQVIGEFTGALPEAQVRQWIDQLVALANERGAPGPVEAAGGDEEAPADGPLEAAYDALARGDLDAAESGLRAALERDPADVNAKAGLAQVLIVRRAQGYDEDALARQLSANPNDPDASLAIADLELLGGQPEAAFTRLIGLIRHVPEEQRPPIKERLLGLFDALDPGDPVVLRARRELANALF